MSITIWQPDRIYQEGEIVVPLTTPAGTVAPIINGDFEMGDDGNWVKGTAWGIGAYGVNFDGTQSARYAANNGISDIAMATGVSAKSGNQITAEVMFNTTTAPAGEASGRVVLQWFTAGAVLIKEDEGDVIQSGVAGFRKASVTASAPGGTATVKIVFRASRIGSSAIPLYIDGFRWNHIAPSALANLIYEATQTGSGVSGTSEPVWPTVVGNTVADGTITWTCVAATTILWQAYPIMESGATEPTWPDAVGASVLDNTIIWTAASFRITDPNCPNTAPVAIGAGKVFAGAGDVVRYCATYNARDWTTRQDAGFLPTGLRQYGANVVSVLNLYRGNLVVMNSQVFQMWQIDPDPTLMAIIDEMPAIGSIYQLAAAPVANDLLYLPALGVRSVGIAGASTNLKAGDVGMPIDPLVQAAIRDIATALGVEPIGQYYPGAGQYWLCFSTPEDRVLNWEPIGDAQPELFLVPTGDTISEFDGETLRIRDVIGAGASVSFDVPMPEDIVYGDMRVTVQSWQQTPGKAANVLGIQNSTLDGVSFTPSQIIKGAAQTQIGLGGITIAGGATQVDCTFKVEFRRILQDGEEESLVFVLDMSGGGAGKWTIYQFGFRIDSFFIDGPDLFIRSGDTIMKVDELALVDQTWGIEGDMEEPGIIETPFDGLIQFPWLDFGQPGADKQLYGFDIAGTGEASVSFGYNQADLNAFTDQLLVPSDTVYEGIIPYEVTGPSLSVRLSYAGGQKWRLNSMNIYLKDR